MPTPPQSRRARSSTDDIFTLDDAKSFVNKEWDRTWSTKASLEQRAITLITTSGVLVTLAFGFTTAITKSKNHSNFTTPERSLLVVSLGLFALSALVSLLINVPKGYSSPDFRDLLNISQERIEEAPLQRLEAAMEAARTINDRKARMLANAFALQLLAIAVLAVVVGIVSA